MRKIIKIVFVFIMTIACGNLNQKKQEVSSDNANNTNSLLENVKLAINPKFKNWVLFQNGTYIIFDSIKDSKNIREEAIRKMKKYGPVSAGGPAGDFNVINLKNPKAWIVSGHCYGMYTYVNPKELDSQTPNDVTVGLFGRSKRNLDGLNPIVIHVNAAAKK
ncbi:MAG: hypothetical protein MK202_11845 [Tenacibaculum sp.]|nr:hypothetical protein [Tenacibaculum sp.]